jgi:hypothetical protein
LQGNTNVVIVQKPLKERSKTYQFELSVKDDIFDDCKNANTKIAGQEILPKEL